MGAIMGSQNVCIRYHRVAIVFLVMVLPSLSLGDNWDHLNPAGTPDGVYGHSMVTLSNGDILLFGGENATGDVFNDLYAFKDNQWNTVQPEDGPPPDRRNHRSWTRNGRMNVFGGLGEDGHLLNDMWIYDPQTNKWSQVACANDPPAPRYDHVAWTDGTKDYIYGGVGTDGSPRSDIWVYDPQTNEWSQRGYAPMTVAGTSAAARDGNLYVLAAFANDAVLKYDPSEGNWSEINTGNPHPDPRPHSLCPAVFEKSEPNRWGQHITLFGGQGSVLEDTWTFNLQTGTWTRGSDMPVALMSGAAAWHEGKILLFGGLKEDGSVSGETYMYTPDVTEEDPNAQDTEWTRQTVPPSVGYLDGIHFINQEVGWAVGGGVYAGNPVILHTTDSGENWTTLTPGITTDMRKCYFINENVGAGICPASPKFSIQNTQDGGSNWAPAQFPDLDGDLNDIQLNSETLGWAVGHYFLDNTQTVLILHTTDGENWSQSTTPATPGDLNSIFFIDALKGWAVGKSRTTDAPLILFTQDGGQTWTEQPNPSQSGFLQHVFFFDGTSGWAVGGTGWTAEDQVALLNTTDGGQTWIEVNTGLNSMANEVYFYTADEGYMVVNTRAAQPSNQWNLTLFKSTDAGGSWNPVLNTIDGGFASDAVLVRGSLWAWIVGTYANQEPLISKAVLVSKKTNATLALDVAPAQAKADGCTATPSGEYDFGTEVNCVATPNAVKGWNFKEWTGDLSGAGNPITVTMNDDKQGTAHFVQPVLTISGVNRKTFICPDMTKDSPYIEIGKLILSANDVDNWLLKGLSFTAFGGYGENDDHDVIDAKLEIAGQTVITEYGQEEAMQLKFSFLTPISIPASGSVSAILSYKMREKKLPLEYIVDYGAECDASKVNAEPQTLQNYIELGSFSSWAYLAAVENIVQGEHYANLQSALEDAAEGDIMEVCCGIHEYKESFVIFQDNLILRSKKGRDETILKSEDSHVVDLNWCHGAVLEGFTLQQMDPVQLGVLLVRANNVKIRNCRFLGGFRGIVIESANLFSEGIEIIQNQFDNNQIDIQGSRIKNGFIKYNQFRNFKIGIEIRSSEFVQIIGNTFSYDTQNAPFIDSDEYFGINVELTDYVRIQNNVINMRQPEGSPPICTGIYCSYRSGRTVMTGNIIKGAGRGVDVTRSESVLITRNDILSNKTGVMIRNKSNNASIVANTFKYNTDNAYFVENSKSVTIDNNICRWNGWPEPENSVGKSSGASKTETAGGILLDEAFVTIRNCQFLQNNDYGVRCINGSNAIIQNNNFSGTEGFAVVNEDETVTLDATANWWGDAGGPNNAGDRVQGVLDASGWLEEPVTLVLSASANKRYLLAGESDTTRFYLQNWETETDQVTLTVTDSLGWLTSPNEMTVQMSDSLGADTTIHFLVPPEMLIGTVNKFVVRAQSQTNGAWTAADSFRVAVCEHVLTDIHVSPVADTLRPGETLQFYAGGYDLRGIAMEFDPQWTATGGTIDSTGLYTAGPTEGTFVVTVSDPVTGLIDSTQVIISSTASMSRQESEKPKKFALMQNYPNPFNPVTLIQFLLPRESRVSLTVYNLLGERVAELVNDLKPAGKHSIQFDASNLSSGIYLYRIQMGGFGAVKKMVVLE